MLIAKMLWQRPEYAELPITAIVIGQEIARGGPRGLDGRDVLARRSGTVSIHYALARDLLCWIPKKCGLKLMVYGTWRGR